MTYLKNTAAAIGIALLGASANAQDLSTEITVDRTIVPREHSVAPLPSVVPSLLPAPDMKSGIKLTEYVLASDFAPEAGTMNPAVHTGLPLAPYYRGYLWAGYFPVYNLGAGAGYRFVDNKTTRVGAAARFDGMSYKMPVRADGKVTVRDNTFGVQAYGSHAFGFGATLDADIDYSHAALMRPLGVDKDRSYGLNVFNARIGFGSSAEKFNYHVGLTTNHFLVSDDLPFEGKPYTGAKDHRYGIDVRVGGKTSDVFGYELGIEALWQTRSGVFSVVRELFDKTGGIYSLNPAVRFGGEKGELRLGAKIDFLTGSGRGSFHVAPDVLLTWTPSSQAAIFAGFSGGDRFNTLSDLYQYSPFAPGMEIFDASYIPVDGRAGFVFGPFKGFSVEIHGRYAVTRNAPMLALPGLSTYAVFEPVDLHGWSAGAKISYRPAAFLDLSVAGDMYSNSYKSAFADMPDRAKTKIEANVAVHPIDRLDIGIGYTLRSGRRCYLIGGDREEAVGMGNVSDLRAKVSYAFTPAVTAFLRGENLLGQRPDVLPGLEAQGVHGLAGVMLRF